MTTTLTASTITINATAYAGTTVWLAVINTVRSSVGDSAAFVSGGNGVVALGRISALVDPQSTSPRVVMLSETKHPIEYTRIRTAGVN